MRRALAAYPDQAVAKAILNKWFQEGGREEGKSHRVKSLASSFGMDRDELNLIIVGCFVEVYLANEGHDGWVVFNILENTQVQSLLALLGAMIAGVDAVPMSGGIPLTVPEVLDNFAALKPAELKLHVVGAGPEDHFRTSLEPRNFVNWTSALKRPCFFPVISTDILASTMVKKAQRSRRWFCCRALSSRRAQRAASPWRRIRPEGQFEPETHKKLRTAILARRRSGIAGSPGRGPALGSSRWAAPDHLCAE